MNNKKLAFNIIRVLVSIGLIAFLFWMMRGSIGEVGLVIKGADKLMLFASFLISLVVIVFLGFRLRMIMKAQHINIALWDTVYLTFIGQFFNNFLPTSTGGDIVKAYYASKKTGRKVHSIACIIMDRLLGTFTLVVMVLSASLIVKKSFLSKSVTSFIIIAIIVSAVIMLVLFSKRVAKKIPFMKFLSRFLNADGKTKDLYDIIYNYKSHPSLLINALGMSILLQAVSFFSVYLIIRSLGFSVPLKLVFLWMPIISTASMAPSINGLGVREGTFVFFFGPLMGKQGAFALGLLFLGINFTTSLIGGVFYIFTKHHKKEI